MTAEKANKITTTVLRALADRSQTATATAADITESRLSRWKNADDNGGGLHLSEVARVMAALGLAVVETEADLIAVTREEYDALKTLARKSLA